MLINTSDFKKVRGVINNRKLLVVPHPCNVSPQLIREQVSVISFVASSYLPNVEAINWFLEDVWTTINNPAIKLHIYGHVGRFLNPRDYDRENIVLFDFVPDTAAIYTATDIVINPVRAGSGLKIKNVEALANGLPLITTTHGSSGLEQGEGAFIIADSAVEFANAIEKLVSSLIERQTLALKAIEFARSNFYAEKCFKPLLDIITVPKKAESL